MDYESIETLIPFPLVDGFGLALIFLIQLQFDSIESRFHPSEEKSEAIIGLRFDSLSAFLDFLLIRGSGL